MNFGKSWNLEKVKIYANNNIQIYIIIKENGNYVQYQRISLEKWGIEREYLNSWKESTLRHWMLSILNDAILSRLRES